MLQEYRLSKARIWRAKVNVRRDGELDSAAVRRSSGANEYSGRSIVI